MSLMPNHTEPNVVEAQTSMPIPLVVDLDGTLTRVDTLHEGLIKLVKEKPTASIRAITWLKAGKARFKSKVTEHVSVDVTLLPYNDAVLGEIKTARKEGRPVILATASDKRVAEDVAKHLGLFDQVIATTEEGNLSGKAKREKLVYQFGVRGFDYVANGAVDLPIWQEARQAYLVDAKASVIAQARKIHPDAKVLSSKTNVVSSLMEAARPYQWVKNLLIFIPVLASQHLTVTTLTQSFIAFLCFGAAASSVYLLNDALDLEADRQHPRKRKRPFASGRAPLLTGLITAVLLMLSALIGSLLLAPAFTLVLVSYLFVTVNYSMWIKRYTLIDVVVLAILYTIRILAGGAATDIPLTLWLLGFSMFLFASLAFAKRYVEVAELLRREEQSAVGRGYRIGDQNVLMSLGTACGMASVLTLGLYVNSASASGLYGQPQFLWAECPLLLYWVSRIWMAAQRRRLTDDPIVFAFKDKASICVAFIALIPVALALWT